MAERLNLTDTSSIPASGSPRTSVPIAAHRNPPLLTTPTERQRRRGRSAWPTTHADLIVLGAQHKRHADTTASRSGRCWQYSRRLLRLSDEGRIRNVLSLVDSEALVP